MSGTMPPPTPPPASRSLRLRPEIAELDSLMEFIEDFAAQQHWTPADTRAFTLAAEELFANTINHSRPPATWVEFSLTSGNSNGNPSAIATYSDDAPPFDPTVYPEVDTSLPLELRPVGGLGIHFIRRSMHRFTYERVEDRNLITFGRSVAQPPVAS